MVKFKKGQERLSYMKTFVKYSTIDHARTHTRTKSRLTNPSQKLLTIEHFAMNFLVLFAYHDGSRQMPTTIAREAPLTKVKLIFAPMKMRIICAGRIHFNFYFAHSVCINRQELMATIVAHALITTIVIVVVEVEKQNEPTSGKNETVRNTVLIE